MKKIIYLNFFLLIFFLTSISVNAKKIPNLVGKWEGENIKSTLKKGFLIKLNLTRREKLSWLLKRQKNKHILNIF